ncbi:MULTISPECIES: PD-(D/E)XK nuclease family protein [unclassified Thiocapsa]|uniref:PD-(D/E)XK nuclease family protein n=1 Tax=unclassified Thiocapsa TaxID=2641286 RepID=UPI0035B2C338
MTTESLKDTLKRELPTWLREDPAFRTYVLELTRDEYADRKETGDRFYELLGELRRDREKQERKWEANQVELDRIREEQAQKWEANQAEWRRLWDENRAEQRRLWEESRADSNRRWDENQEELKRLHNEIMAQTQKFDRGIGALGSRWGLQSEKAFRDALAAILEQSFDVQVVNVTDYDDSGEVFGRPDQIELDVIIKNGLLLICELRSSIDKAGMYIFERKARFYERRHERKANRLIVISPMIDGRARKVGERLGIEMYGDSTEVEAV